MNKESAVYSLAGLVSGKAKNSSRVICLTGVSTICDMLQKSYFYYASKQNFYEQEEFAKLGKHSYLISFQLWASL